MNSVILEPVLKASVARSVQLIGLGHGLKNGLIMPKIHSIQKPELAWLNLIVVEVELAIQ